MWGTWPGKRNLLSSGQDMGRVNLHAAAALQLQAERIQHAVELVLEYSESPVKNEKALLGLLKRVDSVLRGSEEKD
jgi:hypothetical protein